MQQIFQVNYSKLGTTEEALNWITSPEVKGGRNEEKYWLVRTDIAVNNPQNDVAMNSLLLFLDYSRVNHYQTVQILKNV
jgi:hypothetical protein